MKNVQGNPLYYPKWNFRPFLFAAMILALGGFSFTVFSLSTALCFFLACFLAAAGLSVYAVFAHFRYYIYREQAILYIAEERGEPYPVDLNECKIKGVTGAEKGFAGNRLLVFYRGEEIFFYVNKALIKDLLEYDASLFPLYSGKGNRAYAELFYTYGRVTRSLARRVEAKKREMKK